MTDRKPYPSDLDDQQWSLLEPLLPSGAPGPAGGRPRTWCLREVINTLLYQLRTGCQWDYLPHDLVPKSTVYDYFTRWRDDGTFDLILETLRRGVRLEEGREAEPSMLIVDSQSVKTGQKGGSRRMTEGRRSRGESAS